MIFVFFKFLHRTMRNLANTKSLNLKRLGKERNHKKSQISYAKLTHLNIGDVSA